MQSVEVDLGVYGEEVERYEDGFGGVGCKDLGLLLAMKEVPWTCTHADATNVRIPGISLHRAKLI